MHIPTCFWTEVLSPSLIDASGHLLEGIQNYHVLYGFVKVCTGNRAVTEKRNNFFKECQNIDGYHETITGAAEARVTATTTQRNVDPAFGGATYQVPAAGTGVLYDYIQDVFEGTVANHTDTHIPLTLTFFSSVFGGGQDKYFPLSAMNGFRLVLTLNNANNAFQIDEGSVGNKSVVYSINDPTIYRTSFMSIQLSTEVLLMHPEERTDVFEFIHRAGERTVLRFKRVIQSETLLYLFR
jgi:hypothetical protein